MEKMKNLEQLIKERRSIKKYKSDAVPKELIEKVIEAGLYAASGRGTQCPKIIAITDKKMRDKVSKANCEIGGYSEGVDPFYNAPVILLVIVPKDNPTGVYDGSVVLGNMMLMAHNLGLGSCWIHRAKEEMDSPLGEEISKTINLSEKYIGVGHLALGYANTELLPPPARKNDRVFWI